jgi:deoxycytidine triphosphate deaminase
MAIKSDRWIKQMAQEHGMIEPFEERQVRQGAISYGLSSYGYDIRVADEFKIFTSATGEVTVVDPKNFDPKAFKDFQGAECIIPPNSFALAKTVEYFRIPRDVLTVCVGKSTYARCFRGDTRVALVDGTAPTLEEMARRSDDGVLFWGYSIGHGGQMLVTLLEAPRYIGRDSLIEVILDNAQSIFCTPDHLFMMRDGSMLAAHHLRPGDSLMPLYRQQAHGHEVVYQPFDGQLSPTYRMIDEWSLRHTGYQAAPRARPRLHRQDVPGLNDDRSVFRRAPEITQAFRGSQPLSNHKVVAIRDLPGDHDVYCLTVPEAGNFALEAGVFVHNCGIIVNVTPFEPEWEGFVTLEISNTTPLPAKIYANEGIAQVLFFQSDEPCMVSYRDKSGKYQNQQGLTLPKL